MLAPFIVASILSGFPGTTNRAGHTTVDPGFDRRRLEDEPNPYTCPEENHKSATEEWKVMGTNLGGWLVLEPWITPSLFYQFLSSDEKYGTDAPKHTGMDSYTFCDALGPVEGNKQMRRHWQAWVREEDIASIAKTGSNMVRIPVGDWQFAPYGPYIGCMDGANDELRRVLDLCSKYKIKALLDIHAVRGSQNGFDNSGQALAVKWTQVTSQADDGGITTFEHWPIRSAEWAGKFELSSWSYSSINETNINSTLAVVQTIVSMFKDHPAIWGLEPLNEPWQAIPLEVLKKFYWDGYHIVREGAPKWMFVMHDSFRGYPSAWWDFMKGCSHKVLDAHLYQAWNRPGLMSTFYKNACNFRGNVRQMEEQVDMPLIVGEWSLATDNCAMWLNGFNDNLPGYPKVSCRMFPCAAPYMGYEQPGTPPSNEMPLQGPYGTGVSGPQFGQCPVGVEWGDKNNEYMTTLTMKSLNSFNSGHGWFFWNFRTEMEPRWSFIQAYYNGWFPGNVSDVHAAEVVNACPPPTVAAVAAVALPGAVAPTTSIAAVALGLATPQPAATSEATSAPAPTSTPRGVLLLAVGAVVSAVAAASALVARRMRGARREALLEDLLSSSRAADSDYAAYGQ